MALAQLPLAGLQASLSVCTDSWSPSHLSSAASNRGRQSKATTIHFMMLIPSCSQRRSYSELDPCGRLKT